MDHSDTILPGLMNQKNNKKNNRDNNLEGTRNAIRQQANRTNYNGPSAILGKRNNVRTVTEVY